MLLESYDVRKDPVLFIFNASSHNFPRDLAQEVEYLHPADEGEACEEPHGASYSRQLVNQGGGLVLYYVIEYHG